MKRIWQSGLTKFIKNRMPKPDYENFKQYVWSNEYLQFLDLLMEKYWLKLNEEFEIQTQNYKFGATIYVTDLLKEIHRVRMLHF